MNDASLQTGTQPKHSAWFFRLYFIGLTLSLVSIHALMLTPALAERLKFTINDPNYKPLPIAMPTILDASKEHTLKTAVDELTDTTRADIDYAPYFTLLKPQSYLNQQKIEPSNLSAEVQYSDWVNIGASLLIRANLSMIGAEYHARFVAVDIATKRVLLEKTYQDSKNNLRLIAHRFAHDLVFYFTNEDGVYDSHIAFSVRNPGGPQYGTDLVVVDFDGHNPRRVVKNNNINILPAFGARNQSLLFTSLLKNNADLYMSNLNGSDLHLISNQRGLNTGATMSPDGQKIALTLSKDGNSEIYLINLDGSIHRRLTDNWWIDTSPSFSPDGKKIAFVSNRTGNPHIYTMNIDGSDQKRITFQGNYNQTPDWSPRGDEITFTGRDERGRFDLFSVQLESGAIRRLTENQGNNEEPSFSPDGRHIAFISTRSGGRKVWVMNADGSKARLIYDGHGDCEAPAWSKPTTHNP